MSIVIFKETNDSSAHLDECSILDLLMLLVQRHGTFVKMCGGIISLLEYYNRHAKGYSNRHGDAVISWELLKKLGEEASNATYKNAFSLLYDAKG
jgi:hypothetical protein